MTELRIDCVRLDAVWNKPVLLPLDAVALSAHPKQHINGVISPVLYYQTQTPVDLDQSQMVPRQFLCVGDGDRFASNCRYIGTVTCGRITQHVLEVMP